MISEYNKKKEAKGEKVISNEFISEDYPPVVKTTGISPYFIMKKLTKQDPIAVANFIIENALERKKPVTNSQLQKIMFLLQGYCLEKTGQELFCEKINHGRWRPLIFSVEKEFKCYASAPIENKAAYFCFGEKEPTFKAPTVDKKMSKKLKKITNKMLDYDRIEMSNLFFETDRDKQPTDIIDERTKQTWTNFMEYQPDEIIQKYREVTEKLAKC